MKYDFHLAGTLSGVSLWPVGFPPAFVRLMLWHIGPEDRMAWRRSAKTEGIGTERYFLEFFGPLRPSSVVTTLSMLT